MSEWTNFVKKGGYMKKGGKGLKQASIDWKKKGHKKSFSTRSIPFTNHINKLFFQVTAILRICAILKKGFDPDLRQG